MFNQKIYVMKKLKLNQLKKQEMNTIDGGVGSWGFLSSEFEYWDVNFDDACCTNCKDHPGSTSQRDGHGAALHNVM
jgi:hypothetical protein